MRRPLADATLGYGDSSTAHPLESKPLVALHARAETKTVASELQQEDRSKRPVGPPDAKLMMRTEMNYHNGKLINSALKLTIIIKLLNILSCCHVKLSLYSDPKFAKPTEETKENKQFANMPDTFLTSNAKAVPSKNEIKRNVIIGSDTGLKQDSLRILKKYSEGDYGIVSECKNSHERYSAHEKKREEEQQIVNRLANMQFTIPSSILPQRQSKTLHVKNREYLILGSLGRGMSGEVLRVQDLSSGELRAIKCVDLKKMDKESAQGCLDEISMLNKLQAPCVVRMFD